VRGGWGGGCAGLGLHSFKPGPADAARRYLPPTQHHSARPPACTAGLLPRLPQAADRRLLAPPRRGAGGGRGARGGGGPQRRRWRWRRRRRRRRRRRARAQGRHPVAHPAGQVPEQHQGGGRGARGRRLAATEPGERGLAARWILPLPLARRRRAASTPKPHPPHLLPGPPRSRRCATSWTAWWRQTPPPRWAGSWRGGPARRAGSSQTSQLLAACDPPPRPTPAPHPTPPPSPSPPPTPPSGHRVLPVHILPGPHPLPAGAGGGEGWFGGAGRGTAGAPRAAPAPQAAAGAGGSAQGPAPRLCL
jgi:hypothetical protein